MNAILFLALVAAGNPPAVLHCPTALVARGDVKGGPPLLQTFDLTHRGTAGTLTITKIEAGCGCLRRSVTARTLQPGESTRLTLEINTLTQPDGPNRWQAAVGYRLDMPAAPGVAPATSQGEVLLTVTANLSREVSISPAQVAFSTTGEATQKLTVTDRRGKPLTVLRAAGSAPHLTAAIGAPAAGPGETRSQTIVVKLAATAPVGQREEAIVLLTDDPVYPEFRIPVRVLKRAEGGAMAIPAEVTVRFAPGQSEVSTLVQIRGVDGKPVAIASAESDSAAVAVKWSPGSVRVAAVRVTVARGAANAGEGRVRVHLSEPAGTEVVIPVSWR